MPLAIAVVVPPAAAYAWLVASIAGLLYAAYAPRTVVIGLAGGAAGVLALLGYLHVPPDGLGLALLGLGVLLLNAEFLLPTFGAAVVAGLVATTLGSWRLLGALPPVAPLPFAARCTLALAGPVVLLVVTARSVRRYTLPRRTVGS
jgi:membrane-bound serine protease (ClpP class)